MFLRTHVHKYESWLIFYLIGPLFCLTNDACCTAGQDPAARRAIDRLPKKIYSFSEVCLKTEGVQLHMLV